MSRGDLWTCESCFLDFELGEAHDRDACRAARAREKKAREDAYLASLPCCAGLADHGHKGCQASPVMRGLDAPRKDCGHYCTTCVPPMAVTPEVEAAAEAIFRSMRVTRTPWEKMERAGQDHYRKAAKAALRAVRAVATA
jgi:hypothetical protein